MLGGVGAQRVPVPALVQLAVAGGVVAEGVERGAVGVAGCDLGVEGVRVSFFPSYVGGRGVKTGE